MFDFEEIRRKAKEQFQLDCEMLQKTVSEDERYPALVEAIMRLRELDTEARFTLSSVLCGRGVQCGMDDDFLQMFNTVLDPDEFLGLPGDLDWLIWRLMNEVVYHGLYIVRAAVEDESGKRTVRHFLYSDPNMDLMEALGKWFPHQYGLNGHRLIDGKQANVDDFQSLVDFLDILSDKRNWDGFDLVPKAIEGIDKLFKFDEIEET